jgi:hypothetical protein
MAKRHDVSPVAAWAIGVVALIAIGVTAVLTLGISLIFWLPAAIVLGIGMLSVWLGRNRRLAMQGRNANEVKDPLHARHAWPRDAIDDRLPEP